MVGLCYSEFPLEIAKCCREPPLGSFGFLLRMVKFIGYSTENNKGKQ